MSKSPGNLLRRLSGLQPDALHRTASTSDVDVSPRSAAASSPFRTTSSRQQRKEEQRLRRLSSSSVKKAAAAARAAGVYVDDETDAAAFREEWHMTKADEVKCMVQFLTTLQACGKLRTDFEWSVYRRFLRARQHDVPRAVEMWSKHLAWRAEIGADTILEDFNFEEREAFISLYPQGYCNVDKLGRPVYIQQLGQLQFKKLQELTTEERMIKFHVQEYERCVRYILPACSMAAGREIEQTFAILDAKGVGIRHLTGAVKKMLQQIIQIDQNNYPEMLGKTAIINGGAVINFVFPLVRPFLDKRTQNKIEVCPKDFSPTLLQYIDADNLPEYLGGRSRATLLDDSGPWNDSSRLEQIQANLKKEGPRLQWPPEAQGIAMPPSVASSLAGGSPRAGQTPGRTIDDSGVGSISDRQPGRLHVVPLTRATSSGSEISAISADDHYASADGGYLSASDGYASASESLASYPSFGSNAGRRLSDFAAFQPAYVSQPDDGATSRIRSDAGEAIGGNMVSEGAPGRPPSRQNSLPNLRPHATAVQQSITGRVQALELRVQSLNAQLGKAAPQLPPMPGVGGPLMARVEALEIAVDTLLAAKQAQLEAEDARRNSGCCGGCSIM